MDSLYNMHLFASLYISAWIFSIFIASGSFSSTGMLITSIFFLPFVLYFHFCSHFPLVFPLYSCFLFSSFFLFSSDVSCVLGCFVFCFTSSIFNFEFTILLIIFSFKFFFLLLHPFSLYL